MCNKKKIIRASTVPQSLDIFCSGLLKELSQEYEVVALSSPGPELEIIGRREGVRTIGVPMERRISCIRDLKSLRYLLKVFRKEKPDMVHSMTPKAGLLCMLAAWLARVPVRVHTFTGLIFPTSTGFKKMVLMLTDRITCACATNIIPEGEGVKNDLINNGITRKPLCVLGYGNVRGVDMTYYARTTEVEQKAVHLRATGVFTFLFVGRIVRDKGINELIAAFNEINNTYPATRLILVGSFEDNLDPINENTRSLIETHRSIHSVGQKSGTDLLACYAASDCFVFPSYREGFPNTVLEAGAMGLPCIVTDINGSREIIKEGYNGLIVPSHDIDALYEAMSTLLTDDELRSGMAAVARDIIAGHYEQGYVRKCLKEYYHKIL